METTLITTKIAKSLPDLITLAIENWMLLGAALFGLAIAYKLIKACKKLLKFINVSSWLCLPTYFLAVYQYASQNYEALTWPVMLCLVLGGINTLTGLTNKMINIRLRLRSRKLVAK